ncbi:hypothetical protein M5689_004554 [Euphorbia peplus]|nr:hypothetical protein M5689_004554 [Euphorbia peplus]
MEQSFENLSLSVEEEEELLAADAVDETLGEVNEFCLVGRFLTDRTIKFNAMRGRIASVCVWRPGQEVTIRDLGDGVYMFQLYHAFDFKRVIAGGPWTFDGHLLVTHHLQPGEVSSSVSINTMPVWVQVHDIPIGFMTMALGNLLGAFLGDLIEYDEKNNSGGWRSHMRLRVALDVRLCLKRWKNLNLGKGKVATVQFKYEIPFSSPICYFCGKLGHTDMFCSIHFTALEADLKFEWGPWIRAADKKRNDGGGERWLKDPKEARTGSHGVNIRGSRRDTRLNSGDQRGTKMVVMKDKVIPQTVFVQKHCTEVEETPDVDIDLAALEERKRKRTDGSGTSKMPTDNGMMCDAESPDVSINANNASKENISAGFDDESRRTS